jgi:glycosyltransferase involved in cell wall biosynthesis
MEIIVVSDGSTDRTEEIVRSYEKDGVRLIVQHRRQGKTAALNKAVQAAAGDIIVFSDANSLYERDAVGYLVRNFSDPRVGYVTGKMVYVDQNGSLVGAGCSAYMRYENMLRTLETNVGSIVGVDGGIDAVRKSLYEPMPPDMLPDLVLPLSVVAKGFRVVYEEKALVKEDSLTEVNDEARMRVRVTLRSLHALWHMRQLFNPRAGGLFSFQLFMHKLLRYSVGYFQLMLLANNIILLRAGNAYRVLFGLQLAFYTMALRGWNLNRLQRKNDTLAGHSRGKQPGLRDQEAAPAVPSMAVSTEQTQQRPFAAGTWSGAAPFTDAVQEAPPSWSYTNGHGAEKPAMDLPPNLFPGRLSLPADSANDRTASWVSWLFFKGPKMAYYLCVLNACSLFASIIFLRGKKVVVWQPRKG